MPSRAIRRLAGILGLLTIAGILYSNRTNRVFEPVPERRGVRHRRLIADSTSEGQSLRRLDRGHQYLQLVTTPDGGKLYAFERHSITVLQAHTLEVLSRIALPKPYLAAFMTRDGGKIYISSRQGGVMVLETGLDKFGPEIAPQDNPIGVAVSPDNRRLYLALANKGLKRIDLATGASRILSSTACPAYLNIDRSGRHLYVAYQCGGPGGRPGHDVVEIYDLQSEKGVGLIKGLAMVNGQPKFAPNDEVVLLEARDACTTQDYDHAGCPFPAAVGFHLWRPSDGLVASSHWFSKHRYSDQGEFFPTGTRAALFGTHLAIWDWARGTMIEVLDHPEIAGETISITPSESRAFVAFAKNGGLAVLDAEEERCAPLTPGLVNFYSGDGTADDAEGEGRLRITGNVTFSPGRRGRAFLFDGLGSYLSAKGGSRFCGDCGEEWSLSFFVKFNSTTTEMTLWNRDDSEGHRDLTLIKAANHRILLSGNTQQRQNMVSLDTVKQGRWHHVAVVTYPNKRVLFLDGRYQAEGPLVIGSSPQQQPSRISWVTFIGGLQGKSKFFNGLIDEIAIYNRALSRPEIEGYSRANGEIPP